MSNLSREPKEESDAGLSTSNRKADERRSAKATPVTLNGHTPIRDPLESERGSGSIELDIGSDSKADINFANEDHERERTQESGASRKEKASAKGTPINNATPTTERENRQLTLEEKSVLSKAKVDVGAEGNGAPTSERGNRQLTAEEKSVLSKAKVVVGAEGNGVLTSGRGNRQLTAEEKSVLSKAKVDVDAEGNGAPTSGRGNRHPTVQEKSVLSKAKVVVGAEGDSGRQNTDGRGGRKASGSNVERLSKHEPSVNALKTKKEPTSESRRQTTKRPKNPSGDARARAASPFPQLTPRPGETIQNGKAISSINDRAKGKSISARNGQSKDDGGWGGQNTEIVEEAEDKKPQREILQNKRKKTGSVSPPQPFSNNLVLENGRVPAARQQSTLFKEVKGAKPSPRTNDPQSVKLPVLTPRAQQRSASPKETLVSRDSAKKKYVTTTIHSEIAKKRAKADLKQPKLKLAKTESNYVRLCKIVSRVGTDLLRTEFHNYLERQHPPKKLHQFLSSNKRRLKSYASSYKLIMQRWDFMYPNDDENRANLLYLDAAILFWFLRFICTLKRPNDFIWKRKPAHDDHSETGDIARIRDHRNFLINLTSPALYEDEYERKVKELRQIALRIGGGKQGEVFIDSIEEMKTGQVRFSDRDHYLTVLNEWADETGDRNIAPAKNVGETIRERKEMTRRFLKKHRDPKIFVRTKTYQKAQEKLASSGCVVLKGNTGDGKTTMAISLMVAAYDEDECLLITSPDQWEHVDSRAVSAVLMDDIFGSGSLNERLLLQWEAMFEEMHDLCTDTKGRVGVRIIITIRQHILDQCYSTLAKYKLFSRDRFFDTSSTEIPFQEKKAMLGRHLVACDKNMAKSEIEKAAKVHNSRLGFPECCALFVMRDGFMISGSQFFERPIEFLFEAIDRMYDGNKYCYLAMVIMMFQKDGILFRQRLASPNDDTQFRDKLLDLAFLCQIPESDHIFKFTLEGLQTQVGTFVNYYEDRDCFTFSHESIMEAMMASFGERHPQEVLEGCALPFLTDFVGTDATFDERSDEIFIMRVKLSNFDVLAKVFVHYILNGEVKKLAQHRAMKDMRFLQFFFDYIESEANIVDVLLSEDNNFQESPDNSRKVGLLFGAIDQEVPNVELVSAILKTAVHNGDTKEAWCDQELIASLMMSIKRGSYDIYKSLVETGAIDPPDKLLYEEQYLTSVDIVRDLLRRRHWSQEQKDIAIVRASRGIRAESQEIVTLLLQEGASINSIRCGTTALCEAVKSGKLKTVSLLLASGASVDDRDATQQTPLHHACDWNNIEVVKMLLKKNADVNARDSLGFTPFLVAAGWGRETIMDLLCTKRVNPLVLDEQDNTVLHILAANGQSKIMKIATERFPKEINSILIARNRHGWTPLDFALRCGHLGVTKQLIYAVLKTNALKSSHRTFVHTRFYVVRLEDFDVTEKYQYRFLNENLNRTCFQMPRGNWFIQAGNRDEYEEVRLFTMKYENKLRQCLAKS